MTRCALFMPVAGALAPPFALGAAEVFVGVAQRARRLRLLARRDLDVVTASEYRAVDLDDAVLCSFGEDRRVISERKVERGIELLARLDARDADARPEPKRLDVHGKSGSALELLAHGLGVRPASVHARPRRRRAPAARRRAASSEPAACPCSPQPTQRRIRSMARRRARRVPAACRPLRSTRARAASRHRIALPCAPIRRGARAGPSTSMQLAAVARLGAHRHARRAHDQSVDVPVAFELEQVLAGVPGARLRDVDRHRDHAIRRHRRHRLLRGDDRHLVLDGAAPEEDADAQGLRHVATPCGVPSRMISRSRSTSNALRTAS